MAYECISLYLANNANELELRSQIVNVDIFRLFHDFIEGKCDASTIQSSVVIIDMSNSNRQEIIFNKTNGESEKKYGRKTEVKRERIELLGLTFNLVVAEEAPVEKFISRIDMEYKVRIRKSLSWNEWSFDFTAIKQFRANEIKKVVGQYIKRSLKDSEFIDHVSNFNDMIYQIEVEYKGKKSQKLNNSFNDLLGFIETVPFKNNTDIGEIGILLGFPTAKTLKRLVNNPLNFTYDTWQNAILPNIDKYYLLDKADGERALISVTDTTVKIFTSNNSYTINVSTNNSKSVSIYDAEIIGLNTSQRGKNTKSKENVVSWDKLYIFDMLIDNGKDIRENTYEYRIDKIDPFPKSEKKVMVKLTTENYRDEIKKMYEMKRIYEIDGLIFTPDDTYDSVTYKWKIPKRITIDFLVMHSGRKNEFYLFCGITPEYAKALNLEYVDEYEDLFKNYKIRDEYYPMQFTYPNYPNIYKFTPYDKTEPSTLHGHVVEMSYDVKNNHWKVEGFRPDKDEEVIHGERFGNDMKVATDTFKTIIHPITLEDLTKTKINEEKTEKAEKEEEKIEKKIEEVEKPKEDKKKSKKGAGETTDSDEKPTDNVPLTTDNATLTADNAPLTVVNETLTNDDKKYFQNTKNDIYKPLTKFNNFVKRQLINKIPKGSRVLDLGFGRGSDLWSYNGAGVKYLLGCDKDPEALEEARKRTEFLQDERQYKPGTMPKKNLTLETKVVDLNNTYDNIIKEIGADPNSFDAVVMNFALHYIVDSKEKLDQFIKIVKHFIKKDGLVIITIFDGRQIDKLFENNDQYTLGEKYGIKKLYTKFSDFGSKISVLHPFSKGEYYDEFLLNPEDIVTAFKGKNIQGNSFATYMNQYKTENTIQFSKMSDDDKKYASLYYFITFTIPTVSKK